ncbi:MAG: phosphatidylserine/phosphatidylglycerophosphate/cardiolipin synthase family protein [Elusimicrobiaceae bacterium]|nr:phosphatidylserine/phosphatidylglycerophosphate/cardiolipin synthase family protein [Elusimicrobiaceae bacterium]
MKKKGYYACLLGLWFLCGCAHTPVQQETILQREHSPQIPQEIVLSKNILSLKFLQGHKPVYLIANLDKTFQSGNETLVRLSIKKEWDLFPSSVQSVYFLDENIEEIIRQVLLPLVPEEHNRGILLFIQNYDLFLFRDSQGTPSLVPLKDIPQGVEIIGRIEASTFVQLLQEELKKRLLKSNHTETHFLLPLQGMAQTPYLYIDMENKRAIQLQLPNVYKAKMEMSSLGYSTSFIYSFLIKSHLWGIIKAPFTSLHRFEAYASSTLYTFFPPSLRDLKTIPPLASETTGFDLKLFNEWLDRNISRQVYKGRVRLLIDGAEYFPNLMLAMQQAQDSIFAQLYIFRADPYGLTVADLMKKRAAEGIDVRVVLDELNVVWTSDKEPELRPEEGFVQPRTITSYLRKNSPVKVRTHLNPWGTFDHGKVILVDRRLAYTGGMNIGQEYRYIWHDMMVSLEGPVVGKLVKNYYENWSFTGWGGDYAAGYRKLFSRRKRPINRETPDMVNVRLMYTKPNDAEIFKAQREAMRRARKRIYMENPYFSDDRIIKELIEARGRGVDVRVIFPDNNNIPIMDKNNRYIANKLIKNGVRVFFYKGMTHVKAALFDDWAVIGSANVDKMSLYINREMSLGIDDPALINELQTRLFEKDFNSSVELLEPLQIGWLYGVVSSLATQL